MIYHELRCVHCQHPMSKHTMMYSSGRCPYCGFKHPNACTIVKCTEHPYRVEKAGSFLFFFPRYKRVFIEKITNSI